MEDKAPGITETLLVWFSLIFAWVAGETGRVFVAAGLGGAIRWLAVEKRRIRDGVIAVVGGLIVGKYMWPAVLLVPAWLPFGSQQPFPETPNNIAMAAFLAGTLGMSVVKIVTALVEAYAAMLAARMKNSSKQPEE